MGGSYYNGTPMNTIYCYVHGLIVRERRREKTQSNSQSGSTDAKEKSRYYDRAVVRVNRRQHNVVCMGRLS